MRSLEEKKKRKVIWGKVGPQLISRELKFMAGKGIRTHGYVDQTHSFFGVFRLQEQSRI